MCWKRLDIISHSHNLVIPNSLASLHLFFNKEVLFFILLLYFFQFGFPIFCIYYFLISIQTPPTVKGGLTPNEKNHKPFSVVVKIQKDVLLRERNKSEGYRVKKDISKELRQG